MRRSKQCRGTPVQVLLAAAVFIALGAAIAAAAYDYDPQDQQSWQQQQYPDQQQRAMPSQDQGSWPQGQPSGMMQGRNQQLERQVANQLRQEGFGQEGQIMILALGNRVILLGTVPDQAQKQQIEQATNQISGVQQVNNRLQVSEGTGRLNDAQLQQRIQQQLRSQTSAGRDVQVQVRNRRVILSGQVSDWQEMADVLEAAFAAGAWNVTSQLSATGQRQYGMDQTDRGYYPPYGYTPGQEDQMQWQDRQQQRGMRMQQPQGRQQMSASDLALAHRIAVQLQQQLATDKTIQIMNPQALYVHVSQGVVALYGSVLDNNQRQQAEQIARSVRGVQNVQNQLQVAGQGGQFQTFGYVPGPMDQSQWQDQDQWQNGGMQSQTGQGMQGRQQMTSADRQLAQQIAQQLQQQLPGTQVTVTVNQGIATIEGSVRDQNQKQQIERIVQSIPGVQNVQNNLSTGGPGQSQSGQQQFGQQTGPQQMSASDRQLAQQVEQQLQQQLPQADINVSASQGTITLRGSVDSQNEKQQAAQIAQSVRGVQDIQNQINVGEFPALGYIPGQDRQQMGQRQGGARQDILIAHQVAMQLQQQLASGQIVHVMDPQAVYVHVSQGTVTLLGSVQDENQKRQAEQTVQNIRGVQNVQNQLQVGDQWRQMGRQPQMGRQGRQQMSASDMQAAQQIEQRFEQQLPDADITAIVRQGAVTLQGTVQNQNQKQQAEQIARSVQGVRNVRNNLNIAGEAGEFPALGYIPGQEGQARDTGISGDARCIQMLKQGLTDQNLQSMAQNIYVTCHEGTMALYGYVSTENAKDRIEKLTKQIPGIEEVDSSLIVREEGWEPKSDSELREDVESQLWWSPYVDSDKINVSVQNGIVTLSGQAEDWDAMRAAVKNAFDAGAKRVKSRIRYPQAEGQVDIDEGAAERSPGGDTSSNQ